MNSALAILACAAVVTATALDAYIPPIKNKFTKVHGSGTTNPSKFLYKTFHQLMDRSPRPIKLTYDATGSSTGRRNFANTPLFAAGKNDFSCSELPLDAAKEDGLKLKGHSGTTTEYLHIPFVVGAVSVFVNVPNSPADGIKLKPATLAKIFTGEITTWDHADIKADNPSWTGSANTIKVAHRIAGSSSTYMLSGYLDKAAQSHWKIGRSSKFSSCAANTKPSPTNKCWFDGATPLKGSGGVTTFLKDNEYSIGYLDSGHGHKNQLAEVKILNKDNVGSANPVFQDSVDVGKAGISAAATAGIKAAATTGDSIAADDFNTWSKVDTIYQAGSKAWPMVSYSYFLVRKDLSDIGERGPLVKAMIQHTLSKEAQLIAADEFRFAPLCGESTATCTQMEQNIAGLESLIFGPSTCSAIGGAADAKFGKWTFDEHSDVIRTKVYASGTSNPSKVHWEAIQTCTRRMAERHTDIRIQYDAIGSGPGREEFVNRGDYYKGEKVKGIDRPAKPQLITLDMSSTAANTATSFTIGNTVTIETSASQIHDATVGAWNHVDQQLYVHTLVPKGSATAAPAKDETVKVTTAAGTIYASVTYKSFGTTPDDGGYHLTYKSDFGCAELPLSAAQRADMTSQGRVPLHFPMVLGAIGIFVKMPKYTSVCPNGCAPQNGLRLTKELLARIFTGDITTWGHADIVAENPGWNNIPPGDIYVLHRAKGSSSTYLTSQYLNEAGANIWPLGVGSYFPRCAAGTKPSNTNKCWFSGSHAAATSGKVAAGLEANDNAIAYLDAGHGQSITNNNVIEVKIKNKANNYITSAEVGAAGIGAAATSADLPASHESWEGVSLVDQKGNNTWPMVAFSYILVDEDLSRDNKNVSTDAHDTMHARGALIKSYISFITGSDGNDGQTLLPKHGFAPLPAKVIAINKKGLARIQLAEGVSTSLFDCSPPVHMSAFEHKEGPGVFTKIHGSGTTNPSRFLFNLFDQMYARMNMPVKITYDATGSGTGIQNFINHKLFDIGKNDFSCSELTLSPSGSPGLLDTPVLHLPFVLGAMAVFHSVPNAPSTGLRLSPDVLAKIFMGEITTWDHADIKADNPSWEGSANTIKVVHRIAGSSTTSGFTEYLHASSPSVWKLGKKKEFPSCAAGSKPGTNNECWFVGAQGASGSGGVTDYLKANQYAIGYLDAGHGHGNELTEVKLKNLAGTWLDSNDAGDEGVGAAATAAIKAGQIPDSHGDWSAVTLINQGGEKTWPIVSFSYFLMRENLVSLGFKGGLVKKMVQHVLSAEGQALAKSYKFYPLPQSVKDKNTAGLARLKVHAGTSPEQWKLPAESEVATVKLYASGTTNPKRVHWWAMQQVETRLKHKDRGAHNVALSYDAIGSGPGRAEFVNPGDYPGPQSGVNASYYRGGEKITGVKRPAAPTTETQNTGGYSKRWKSDLGCSELPLDKDQEAAITERGLGGALHLPVVIGAIGFFHNVPEAKVHGSLKLSAKVLAKIFSRQITNWNHHEIADDNPSLTLPDHDIKVVHRIKGSSSTKLSTHYLAIAAGSTWTLGEGSTINWPADTIGARGSGKVAETLQDTLYTIGYLDVGHGVREELGEVSLKNGAGNWVKPSTADVASAAESLAAEGKIPEAHKMAEWREVSLMNKLGRNAWPIVTFSYMLVMEDLTTAGNKGHLIKEYLRFLFSDEVQDYTSEHGFYKLPKAIVDNNLAGLKRLKLGAAPSVHYDMSAPSYKKQKTYQFSGAEVAGFVLGFGLLISGFTALVMKRLSANAANAAASRVVAESQLNVLPNDKTGSV